MGENALYQPIQCQMLIVYQNRLMNQFQTVVEKMNNKKSTESLFTNFNEVTIKGALSRNFIVEFKTVKMSQSKHTNNQSRR